MSKGRDDMPVASRITASPRRPDDEPPSAIKKLVSTLREILAFVPNMAGLADAWFKKKTSELDLATEQNQQTIEALRDQREAARRSERVIMQQVERDAGAFEEQKERGEAPIVPESEAKRRLEELICELRLKHGGNIDAQILRNLLMTSGRIGQMKGNAEHWKTLGAAEERSEE